MELRWRDSDLLFFSAPRRSRSVTSKCLIIRIAPSHFMFVGVPPAHGSPNVEPDTDSTSTSELASKLSLKVIMSLNMLITDFCFFTGPKCHCNLCNLCYQHWTAEPWYIKKTRKFSHFLCQGGGERKK